MDHNNYYALIGFLSMGVANGGHGNLCVWLMRVGVERFST